MKIQYKLLLTFFLLIVIGILFYSTWVQWQDNQETFLERLRPIKPTKIITHGSWIHDLAFSPSNPDLLVTVGQSNKIKIWNITNQEASIVRVSRHPVKEDDAYVFLNIEFSHSGNYLISQDFWMTVLWDIHTGEMINTLDSAGNIGALSPTNDYYAAGTHYTKLWDFSDTKNIKEMYILPYKMNGKAVSHYEIDPKKNDWNTAIRFRNETINQRYVAIDFSHDNRWIGAAMETHNRDTGENENIVKIWNLKSKELHKILKIEIPEGIESDRPGIVRYKITSISFSSDNRFFAVGSDYGLTIYRLSDWTIFHQDHGINVRDIEFSIDGGIFAVADSKNITLWSIDTLTPIAVLKGKGLLSNSVVVKTSPDDKFIVGGGMDGIVRFWDFKKIKEKVE